MSKEENHIKKFNKWLIENGFVNKTDEYRNKAFITFPNEKMIEKLKKQKDIK